MKLAVLIVIVSVAFIYAGSIEVGSSEFSSNKPFCANWTSSLRYQVIVQSDEFEEPFTISSITFSPVPGTGEETIFYQLSIDLGYCISGELESVYEDNYVSGTKTRVFERTSNFTVSSHSPTLYFDSPFDFDPAEGNLIIDMVWPDGEGEFYTYNFATPAVSAIAGAYDMPTGYTFTDMSHLLIGGELSMSQLTFAGIKKQFF